MFYFLLFCSQRRHDPKSSRFTRPSVFSRRSCQLLDNDAETSRAEYRNGSAVDSRASPPCPSGPPPTPVTTALRLPIPHHALREGSEVARPLCMSVLALALSSESPLARRTFDIGSRNKHQEGKDNRISHVDT